MKAFELKNGVLHEDGKPVFALGQSYYASYHPQKVPVLPEGDRLGEMRKDIDGMVEAGFNLFRMAALGEVKRTESGAVVVDFPLVDAMADYAARKGIATMLRLQGYGTNLSGYADATMLNERDEEMPFKWDWFVRNCLNHAGILKDDEDACVASAAHFASFSSVVGFQIYNEPAYPSQGFYDYNPHSIRAWRRWLVERGLKTAAESESLDAPRRRPLPGEPPDDWVNWRLFLGERLNDYLNHLAEKAKEGWARPETLTCHMPCPLWPGAALRGEDYFRVAERMDILGITHYISSVGPSSYHASEVVDMAESAAAIHGKHAWIVEYNGMTEMSAEEWERETYAAIGCGVKGIMYYQWRADYPLPDSPEPERFGMVFNSGRKSRKFERAVAMNQLVRELGPLLVQAEKLRSGVAALFSEHANAWHDALDNRGVDDPRDDRNVHHMLHSYAAFRRAGVAVDFVRASDLAANPLGTKLLLVPSPAALAELEKSQVEAFRQAGGLVYNFDAFVGGFNVPGQPLVLDAGSALLQARITPRFQVGDPRLDVKTLEGRDAGGRYLVVCLVNIDPLEQAIPAGLALRLNVDGVFTQAEFFAPGRRERLEVVGGDGALELVLPRVATGGFVIVSA